MQDFLNQCTNSVYELLGSSLQLATERRNPVVLPLHLLRVTLNSSLAIPFFQAVGIAIDDLRHIIDLELQKLPIARIDQSRFDRTCEQFLESTLQLMHQLHDSHVSIEHIILGFAQTSFLPDSVLKFLHGHNFIFDTVKKHIQQLRTQEEAEGSGGKQTHQVLEKYCINMTKQAADGKLDPVIGRHEEIRRVMHILSRRTKNNPVLIGDPGVGKTAIVEGIAQRIVAKDVPDSLKNKKLYALDLGLLIAGAKYQGEFEDRLKNLLKEIEAHQDDIILFIDELHMLVGTGSTGGGMDASNLLKPALARGLIHCIGATTVMEYKKYIEKDAALERRFQKVLVEEPTVEDAISILRGLKERFELHHGIYIKDQALVEAVRLSTQYIPDRFLPDKAIDLVDEAAAMVKMSIESQPENLDRLERRIKQLEIEKLALHKEKDDPVAAARLEVVHRELANAKEEFNGLSAQWKAEKQPLIEVNKTKEDIERAQYRFLQAERDGNFEKASEIKYGEIAALEKKLVNAQEKIKQLSSHLLKQEVDETDIAKVLSRWTGIPVQKLQIEESTQLLQLADLLAQRVIGQPEAVEKVAHAIQVHRAGITDQRRPIGSFLFLGPTGVGKTELAKALAEFLFNDATQLIRIDMSEYMEKHAVARLIGAPPGYVGHEEGGQLTEQVRRKPYSIILFDEIEKAHTDVFNIFLQILDEGHLTDSKGRTVSFKNTLIIMTSNIGSDIILQTKDLTKEVERSVEQLLHVQFKPEFLNRIDDIVFFHRLTPENMQAIVRLQIADLIRRLQERNVEVTVSDQLLAHIAHEGYVPEFGARPIKRLIQKDVQVPVARYLLQNPEAQSLQLDFRDGVVQITDGV